MLIGSGCNYNKIAIKDSVESAFLTFAALFMWACQFKWESRTNPKYSKKFTFSITLPLNSPLLPGYSADKNRNSTFVRNCFSDRVPKQERKRTKEEIRFLSEIVPLQELFFGPKMDNKGIPILVRNHSSQELRNRYKHGQCWAVK